MSETETSTARVAKAANLFDLRRIIGGVFIALGLLLMLMGLFESQAETDKAAGVNINLWTGLGMLVFGILMIVWALTRPLGDEIVEGESWAETPPPVGLDAAALASHQRGGEPGRHPDRVGGPADPRPK